ncbi:MAG TPA: EAL domain-containing response regulator [Alphaproteobacteria bacterium]|jgi:EAL domain-containing protein (putative c-di-GMP-specific phosphodiesterase class I)
MGEASENRLLIIDDEAQIRSLVIDVAEIAGFAAQEADEPEAFFDACASFQPTVIVLDLQMPQADGIEILRRLSQDKVVAKVLLISGVDQKVLNTAKRFGSAEGLQMLGALTKPFDLNELKALLAKARRGAPTFARADLERAIDNREFVVYYQPKVKLDAEKAQKIEGAEALVRWMHPQHGLLPPDSFIPLAERENVIGRLTDLVLDISFDHLRLCLKANPSLLLSVNFAAQLLDDLDMPDRLARMAQDRGLPAEQIILEITETGVMRDAIRVMDVLTRFRLKNFGLSMDDFGTGYSSLVQLYRLPFSELKIDKSFVMDADSSEEARAIIRSAILLGHELKLNVCAEGVETQSALDFLYSLGCDKAQGYLIGRPMPADRFLELLTNEASSD